MKRKRSRIGPIICIFGGALLLAPVAFAALISLWQEPFPNGGSGSPMDAHFVWAGTAMNPHNHSIVAVANPNEARFLRVRNNFPDEVVASQDPPSSPTKILAGATKRYWRSYNATNVMIAGNNYYWSWDEWNIYADCGSMRQSAGGTSAEYSCLAPYPHN